MQRAMLLLQGRYCFQFDCKHFKTQQICNEVLMKCLNTSFTMRSSEITI